MRGGLEHLVEDTAAVARRLVELLRVGEPAALGGMSAATTWRGAHSFETLSGAHSSPLCASSKSKKPSSLVAAVVVCSKESTSTSEAVGWAEDSFTVVGASVDCNGWRDASSARAPPNILRSTARKSYLRVSKDM